MKKVERIAIIGGGIAGLSAAVELLKHPQIEIELFEAKNEIGGRVYSFRDPVTNETVDNGKHLMVGAYHHFFKLLNELNTFKFLRFQDYLKVDFTDGKSNYKFSSGRFGKLSQIFSFLKNTQFSVTEKINFIRFVSRIEKLLKSTNSEITALKLLEIEKQSENLIKHLWEPLILATMNIRPKEGSAKIFLEILSKAIFSTSHNQKLVFSEIPLLDLLKPFEEIQNTNLKLHKSTLINKIERISNKWEITSQNGDLWGFDALILALTPKQCSKLLTELEIDSLIKIVELSEKFEFSPIVSVYLWTENDFIEENFIGLIVTEFQWLFKEKSNKIRYTLTKSNAEDLILKSRKEILEQVFHDLEKCFPCFNRNDIYHHQIIFEKQATIKITPEIEKLRPDQRIEKGLYICGDWTNTHLPATMESAAKSGVLAADFLLKDFFED